MDPAPASRDFNIANPLTYLQVAGGCLSRPTGYFQGMAQATSLAPPLFYLAITALLTMLISLTVTGQWGQLSLASFVAGWANRVMQPLLVAILLWLAVRVALKTKLELGQVFRVVAYPGAVWMLSPLVILLPLAGGVVLMALIAGVHLYVMMKGVMVLAQTSVPLAIACQAIALVVFMLLAALLR